MIIIYENNERSSSSAVKNNVKSLLYLYGCDFFYSSLYSCMDSITRVVGLRILRLLASGDWRRIRDAHNDENNTVERTYENKKTTLVSNIGDEYPISTLKHSRYLKTN